MSSEVSPAEERWLISPQAPEVAPSRPSPVSQIGAAPRALREFTLRLLRQERSDPHASEAELVDAAERCLLQLGDHLRSLIGAEGYRALVARSLQLATTEHGFLESVVPELDPPGRLSGLHQSLRRAPEAEVRSAAVSVLAGLIWLLTTFIGEDLTLRLLRDVWPRLPRRWRGTLPGGPTLAS
jgi:hypothetical protein